MNRRTPDRQSDVRRAALSPPCVRLVRGCAVVQTVCGRETGARPWKPGCHRGSGFAANHGFAGRPGQAGSCSKMKRKGFAAEAEDCHQLTAALAASARDSPRGLSEATEALRASGTLRGAKAHINRGNLFRGARHCLLACHGRNAGWSRRKKYDRPIMMRMPPGAGAAAPQNKRAGL